MGSLGSQRSTPLWDTGIFNTRLYMVLVPLLCLFYGLLQRVYPVYGPTMYRLRDYFTTDEFSNFESPLATHKFFQISLLKKFSRIPRVA
jgi:hypothetical protein